jgi:hypothetical protein
LRARSRVASFVCLFVCLRICLFVCLFARLFLSRARLRQGYSGVLTGYSGSTQEVPAGFVAAGAAADRNLGCGRGAAAGGGGVGGQKVLQSPAEFFRVLLSTVDLGNGLRPFLLLAVPTQRRSHSAPFPLSAVPTSYRSHLVPFPPYTYLGTVSVLLGTPRGVPQERKSTPWVLGYAKGTPRVLQLQSKGASRALHDGYAGGIRGVLQGYSKGTPAVALAAGRTAPTAIDG